MQCQRAKFITVCEGQEGIVTRRMRIGFTATCRRTSIQSKKKGKTRKTIIDRIDEQPQRPPHDTYGTLTKRSGEIYLSLLFTSPGVSASDGAQCNDTRIDTHTSLIPSCRTAKRGCLCLVYVRRMNMHFQFRENGFTNDTTIPLVSCTRRNVRISESKRATEFSW